jgi:mannosyltransferase OCH1-like enzyme
MVSDPYRAKGCSLHHPAHILTHKHPEMAFLSPRMIAASCLALLLLLLLVYSTSCIREELLFSALLDSLFITFDDFTPGYAKALNLSISEQIPIQYDNPLSSTAKIPRIIHHIWFAGILRDAPAQTEIPPIWSGAQAMCRDNNPNFTIHVWTAETGQGFIQEHYSWFIPTYNGYAFPIQRVDALKYFLLWHYGGIYIDLDISCRRPLDPLLEFSAWFPRASPLGVNNDLMASRPGHPVFGKMIQSLQAYNHHYYFTYPTVFWSTGPMFVDTVLKDYWFRSNKVTRALAEGTSTSIWSDHTTAIDGLIEEVDRDHRYSGPGDVAVLPQIFYSEEYTFFGHRPGGSWHGDDVVVVVWMWKRLRVVLLVALLFVGVLLGARRMGIKRIKRIAYQKLTLLQDILD